MELPNSFAPDYSLRGHTALLDLPVELIEWIAKLLQPEDLSRIRLVCRDLNAVTWSHFRLRFKDKTFIIANRTSMKALLRISQHREVARSVKLVRFCLQLLDTGTDFQKRDKVKHYPSYLRLPRPGSRQRALCVERRARFLELSAEEYDYIGGPYGIPKEGCELGRDLHCIFRNFLSHGVAPGVVAVREHAFQHPWGLNQLKDALGASCSLSGRSRIYFISQIMAAISDTRYPLSEIVVGSKGLPMITNWFSSHRINARYLRKLDFVMDPLLSRDFGPAPRSTWEHALVAGLLMTLINAPKLEELSIGLERQSPLHSWDEQTQIGIMKLGHLAGHHTTPKLKRFRLDNFRIQFIAMERIVQQHQSTLEELSLSNVPEWSLALDDFRQKAERLMQEGKPEKNVTVSMSFRERH